MIHHKSTTVKNPKYTHQWASNIDKHWQKYYPEVLPKQNFDGTVLYTDRSKR